MRPTSRNNLALWGYLRGLALAYGNDPEGLDLFDGYLLQRAVAVKQCPTIQTFLGLAPSQLRTPPGYKRLRGGRLVPVRGPQMRAERSLGANRVRFSGAETAEDFELLAASGLVNRG